MSENGVQVDSRSIDKAMRDPASGLWIHFHTDNCSLDDLWHAFDQANDPDGTESFGGYKSPTGWVFEVETADPENFKEWMAQLVAGLEGRGVTGRLEAARPTYIGGWPTEDPTPAAFLAWPEDIELATADKQRRSHWLVPPDATEQIVAHAAAWTGAGGDQAVVGIGIFPLAVSSEADIASLMGSSLINNNRTDSIRYQSDQQRGRMATFSPGGAAVMQEIGASVPWEKRLEASFEALTTAPAEHLDLAFIRAAPKYTRHWDQIDIRQKRDPLQKLPNLLHESDIRYNRHLLSGWTPDAHGIQILTDQHLSRARDLSSWNIRDLGHDRYLIEAEDLAPWYSTPLPDQEVVDQARHDFGDMILTKEVIEANPPPWKKPEDWVSRLVAGLEARGARRRTGDIKGAYVGDDWRRTEDPTPAAFLGWPQDLDAATADGSRHGRWHVPAEATEQIVAHTAAWTEVGGEESIVYLGSFPLAVSPDSDIPSLMRSSLIHSGGTANIRYRSDPERGRIATFGPAGAATMQEIGASVPWQHRLEAVYEALTTAPTEHLDLAFIRSAPWYTRSWEQIDIKQKLPDLHESDIRYNRHLLSGWTPDAHGIQILTGQHLSRARDLSSWNIRDLGHDRYLVEGVDLAAWYSTPLPDQEVVDQARHDFGDMILTKEVIAANPPPWRSA
jgi:hypothetical protein